MDDVTMHATGKSGSCAFWTHAAPLSHCPADGSPHPSATSCHWTGRFWRSPPLGVQVPATLFGATSRTLSGGSPLGSETTIGVQTSSATSVSDPERTLQPVVA